jgi:thioredoxin-like negative regulator of GroEL
MEAGATHPPAVPYIGAAELTNMLNSDDRLLLVEFCVPRGCFRCDEMRAQIDRLASDERIVVRRVDFNQHPELTSRLGVSVCPSYVAFHQGQEQFRAAYPTSADLIVAKLAESLSGADSP